MYMPIAHSVLGYYLRQYILQKFKRMNNNAN